MVVDYDGWRRFPDGNQPGAERIGFLTDKSMIFPGKKIDVVQIWTNDTGYEITFKGQTTLPKEQVEDYLRRRAHSIEEIVRVWLKTRGVMVIAEGTTMVERRMADKVSVLSPNNDTVTIEMDATTTCRYAASSSGAIRPSKIWTKMPRNMTITTPSRGCRRHS